MTPTLNAGSWAGVDGWVFLLAAFGAMLLAVWLLDRRRRRRGSTSLTMIVGLCLNALWCLLLSVDGRGGLVAGLGEVARNLGWLVVVLNLFARDNRDETVAPVRPVLAALALVELFQIALAILFTRFGKIPAAAEMIVQLSDLFHLLMTTGALVLVHNLYVGAVAGRRAADRWNCMALALIWGYDLNYYTIAYLGHSVPEDLVMLRGLAQGVAVVLFGLGERSGSHARFSPSRAVAFQSLVLLVIGVYLILMVGAAQSVAWLGGNASALVQLGFAFATTVAIIAAVPSSRLRRWLNVVLAKHFFQHRYDYRAEWLRFTRTIGRAGPNAQPLHARLVQAVADITDSARGLLLVPGEGGDLVLAARWQWPTLEVPASALPQDAVAFLERRGFIVDLDQIRAGTDFEGEAAIVPGWMIAEEAIWVLVPLIHFDRLVGLVVLGRPSVARELDWEDFDLLRVVGQQLASYLAEHGSQVALLEASRFDEFNRRMAFVMHDIKNLASQLALLARNAERHADNPAFRSDMLVTLRNAADKLNALIARLSRYGSGTVQAIEQIDAADVIRGIAHRANAALGRDQVLAADVRPCRILAGREPLEQVLSHLVQNALDATDNGLGVVLNTRVDGAEGVIEVIDSGCGMSADFVRNRLFTPFVSTKSGGFGIGAFEARELVKAMRGKLEVESREGLGSRFSVRLPLAPSEPDTSISSSRTSPESPMKVTRA
ncbi:multi-sensor signal transduction histidine kinase [Novosphingobium nitrogenifigens DSM 19370]|uniref:histidine kinase n=1 Tax=Novosphingobium nitrogenifigens DSM 19370 TaxID=983920 RepID=F1Z9I0_9SPHN|nr:XrtA/PEP-CTERM system histidine kinase PrsK [Novosphingobium nitrogenifigens]EGD58762.1 multi-sensor signal transduction histidine kinase [Novosphingobium nitrogenifigens DSM 19370]